MPKGSPKLNFLLSAAHRIFETPAGYNAIQLVNKPTVNMIRSTMVKHLTFGQSEKVLDIGCGTGNYRDLFSTNYCGVDINPAYIEVCKEKMAGTFLVGDGTDLKLATASFDHAVTIATTHHLDDAQLAQMVQEGLRVVRPGGFFHIVDAVLPVTSRALLKTIWFNMDRGRHPRKFVRLQEIVERSGTISKTDLTFGLLHDIAYLRVQPITVS
jgi:ubiquinone/menaquinone biosynthesis C-methylase UbiE